VARSSGSPVATSSECQRLFDAAVLAGGRACAFEKILQRFEVSRVDDFSLEDRFNRRRH